MCERLYTCWLYGKPIIIINIIWFACLVNSRQFAHAYQIIFLFGIRMTASNEFTVKWLRNRKRNAGTDQCAPNFSCDGIKSHFRTFKFIYLYIASLTISVAWDYNCNRISVKWAYLLCMYTFIIIHMCVSTTLMETSIHFSTFIS